MFERKLKNMTLEDYITIKKGVKQLAIIAGVILALNFYKQMEGTFHVLDYIRREKGLEAMLEYDNNKLAEYEEKNLFYKISNIGEYYALKMKY